MARTVLEVLRSLLGNDESVVTNSDGQRVVTVEAVEQAVDGLILFDEPVGETESTTEPTSDETLPSFATVENLSEVIDRLVVLENLIQAADTVKTVTGGEVEIW